MGEFKPYRNKARLHGFTNRAVVLQGSCVIDSSEDHSRQIEDAEAAAEAKGESSESSASATPEEAASEEAEAKAEATPEEPKADGAEDIEAWLAVVCRNIDAPQEEEPEPEPEAAKPEPKKVEPEPEEPEPDPEAAKPEPKKVEAESKEPEAESKEPEPKPEEPEAESKEPEPEPKEPKAEGEEPRAESEEPRAESEEPEAKTEKSEPEPEEPEAELETAETKLEPTEDVKTSEVPGPAEEPEPELKLVRQPADEPSEPEEEAASELKLVRPPTIDEPPASEEEEPEGLKLVRQPDSTEPPQLTLGPVPAVVLEAEQTPEESAELVGAAEPSQDFFGAPESPNDELFSGPGQAIQEAPLMGGGTTAAADEVDDIFKPKVEAQPTVEPQSYETVGLPNTEGLPAVQPKSFDTIGMGTTPLPKAESPAEKVATPETEQSSETVAPTAEASSSETLDVDGKPKAVEEESKSYETVLDVKSKPDKSVPEKSAPEKTPSTANSGSRLTLDAELLKSDRKPDKAEQAQTFQKTGQSKVTPGASLKFLEQALAKSVPGKLPEGLKKRAVTAIRYVFTKGSVQRAAVLAEDDQGRLEALAVGGFSPDLGSMEQIPDRLLRATKTSGKPLLMVDCIRDPRFAKDPVVTKFEVRSVACIPFTDKETGSKGFLYLDNCTAPNAFSYQDLDELTTFAQKLATQTDLSEYETSTPVSTSSGSEQLTVEVPPPSPWWIVGAIVAAIILVTPALYSTFTKEDVPKRAQTTSSQPIENPAAVIQGFIRSLDAKSYEGAYSYLSVDLKSKISQEDFDKKLKRDMEKYDKAWRLSRVNIRGGNVDQESLKSFRVTVGHSGPWNWTLQKSEGKWYLHEFDGGLSIP